MRDPVLLRSTIICKSTRIELDSDTLALNVDPDERTIFVLFRASFCWHAYLSASMVSHRATDSAWSRPLTRYL